MNYLIITNFYRVIKDKISELCDSNSDIIRFDLNYDSLEQIIDEAKYDSLFSSNKNIVVFNSEPLFKGKLSDELSDLLCNYLLNPNPNTTMIFISAEKDDSRKKASKILNKDNHVLNYLKPTYSDLTNIVNNYIKKNRYNISNDVANYIIKCCNNNYDLICNEIDKMILCFSEGTSLDDAKKIVSSSINDSIYKFNDELIARNGVKATAILNDLKVLKIDPIMILIMLYKEYKNMLLYKLSLKNNNSSDYVLKKEGLQDWQINKIINNAKLYNIDELKRIINILSNYDYKYKKGEYDKYNIIEMLIMDILY